MERCNCPNRGQRSLFGKCQLHADYRHVGVQEDEQDDETAEEGPEGDAYKYLRVVDEFLLSVLKHIRSTFQHFAAMPFLTVTIFLGVDSRRERPVRPRLTIGCLKSPYRGANQNFFQNNRGSPVAIALPSM